MKIVSLQRTLEDMGDCSDTPFQQGYLGTPNGQKMTVSV